MSAPSWFPDTFDQSLSRSQVEGALAGSIGNIIQDISGLLPNTVHLDLTYADNPLKKTRILFDHLDAQFGNAPLVHAFQQAVLKRGEIDYMVNMDLRVSVAAAGKKTMQFIRNCPHPSKFFQGRNDTLQQLASLFQQTEQKEQKTVLLYGLGGVGKTQIALKFIAVSGSRFTHQFKVDASSKETIQAGYKQIARDKKLGDTVEAAQAWLEANEEEWLIFLDNADQRDLDLAPHLPQCAHGNILITSRNPELWTHTGSHKMAIRITDLSLDNAAILLLNRAGVEIEMHENKKNADAIAKELHCFPLAIIQAGAFIGKSPHLRENISKYIQLYQKNKAALLSEKPVQSSADYDGTVYTTWKMSFAQLSQVEPLAAQFLQLCSFIHWEGITEDIFQRASMYKIGDGPLDPTVDILESSLEFLSRFKNTDMTWNSLIFEQMASHISGYSLMTWNNGGYYIHPLVHQWSRTTIGDPDAYGRLMVCLFGNGCCLYSGCNTRNATVTASCQIIRGCWPDEYRV
ncbi:P-loop containing nucleoside triphosphate hydrolase protein [Mycena amicta]|nr:P-loop containing nucleoside triphosphate hydrolase protein [Mycena amicta]